MYVETFLIAWTSCVDFKTNGSQFWLLGYEFPATLMVFTTEAMYVVTTAKKGKLSPYPDLLAASYSYALAAKHLEPLQGGKIPVEVLVTTKDPEQKTQTFERCLQVIKDAGVSLPHALRTLLGILTWTSKNKVGVLPKETASGPFADDWKRVYAGKPGEIEEVDIAPALSSAAFSVKDPGELVGFTILPKPAATNHCEKGLDPKCGKSMQRSDVGILRGRNVTPPRRREEDDSQSSLREDGYED